MIAAGFLIVVCDFSGVRNAEFGTLVTVSIIYDCFVVIFAECPAKNATWGKETGPELLSTMQTLRQNTLTPQNITRNVYATWIGNKLVSLEKKQLFVTLKK